MVMKWPDGKKIAVSISFDVDAESAFVLDENNHKRLSLLSTGAYGRRVGIPRILRLLDKHGVTANFFVPGYTAEIDPGLIETIAHHGHNIGCHGYYHERTDTLTADQENEILIKSKQILQDITGAVPTAFRAPLWEVTPQTLGLLVQHGFETDSSLMGSDIPYVLQVGNERLLEIPVTWLLDDWEQFAYHAEPANGYVIEEPDKVFRMWKEEFDALYEEGRFFSLTMHPEIIGRASRMKMLDRLIEYMKSHPDVWFVTHRDLYQLWKNGQIEFEEYPY
jgi:peptidoglycan/xylan/chitin deacetylase (PgdA/CDA1 family)